MQELRKPYNDELRRVIAETRDLVRASAELLDQPKPDTFLGRKTQEPFPTRAEGD